MFSVSVRRSGESGYCNQGRFLTVHRYVVGVARFNRAEEQEVLPIPPGPVYVFGITCTEKLCIRITHTHAREDTKPKASGADVVPVHQGYNTLHNSSSGREP